MRYQTHDDDASHFTISCDLCESNFASEQPNANGIVKDNLPDGAIEISSGVNSIDICPTCRYAGAAQYLADNQIGPRKMGVVIAGALWSVFRNLRQTQNSYISESGYRLAELTAPDFDPQLQKEAVLRNLTQAYYNMSEMISLLGIAINELNRLGWPIQLAYADNETSKEWPQSSEDYKR